VLAVTSAPTAPHLTRLIDALAQSRSRWVVLDFAGVEAIDSFGLSVLLHSDHRLRRSGGAVVLARPRPSAQQLLALTGYPTGCR
jgi:anti-anti-sigma factor